VNVRPARRTRARGLANGRVRWIAPAALAAVGVLVGCRGNESTFASKPKEPSSTTTAAPATAASPWASEPIDTLAIGDAPDFPQDLDHWTLRASWSGLPRAFTGDQWTVTEGPNYDPFPASMSGCSGGRFLIRWRAADKFSVQAAQVDYEGTVGKQVSGSAGWMDLDACSAPAFKLVGDLPGGGNLEDVTVEIREYKPAP
jgi:hypothetical protein